MARLREVVGFTGSGLPVTQAGNLKVVDALALARRLGGACDGVVEDIRAMDDLPDVAFLFRWAVAAELVARRGSKIVAGSIAVELERDPLAAWLRVAITRLEHGPLEGFRCGWRRTYVELLDANVVGLLATIARGGWHGPARRDRGLRLGADRGSLTARAVARCSTQPVKEARMAYGATIY